MLEKEVQEEGNLPHSSGVVPLPPNRQDKTGRWEIKKIKKIKQIKRKKKQLNVR